MNRAIDQLTNQRMELHELNKVFSLNFANSVCDDNSSITLNGSVSKTVTAGIEHVDFWSFVWDGRDIVHYLTHSLDFLQTIPVIVDWFTPKYFRGGVNPLSLPIDVDTDLVPLFYTKEQVHLLVDTCV